jgi:hypothetical protein
MCHVLYMASGKERPLVSCDDSRRGFHVRHGAEVALPHLTKPHLHYLGSDQGCGCGFQHLPLDMMEDEEQRATVKTNQEGLARYLSSCLADEESIELFTCWNGDESHPLEHRRDIHVSDLLKDDFEFMEKELVTVRA